MIQRTMPVDRLVLERMTGQLKARGPDDQGIWSAGRVGLGHRRLSIIDLSSAGHQPMFNEDGTVAIVFNGEIYNADELRKDLKRRHTFKSATDTEVLLHLYEEQGQDLCRSIEGMFAFVIYDQAHRRLVCARDRFGEKPFYYVLTNDFFVFASEPKSLYHYPALRPQLGINPDALLKYFVYGFVPAPDCLIQPIRKLEAATIAEFDLTTWQMSPKRYWDLANCVTPVASRLTAAEALPRLDSLLSAAIERRLMADVPIGIFLSGGLDSSLVAAYIAKAGRPLNAYTIAASDRAIDESAQAALTARYLQIPHHRVTLTQHDVLTTCADVIAYTDEPIADAALFYTAFLARAVRQEITVAVSGDGGDELFGGYLKYRTQLAASYVAPFNKSSLWPLLGRLVRPYAPAWAKIFSVFPYPMAQRHYLWGGGSPTLNEVAVLTRRMAVQAGTIFSDAQRALQRVRTRDIVTAGLYLDSRILLPDGYNAKTDRATMAHSLELRSPLQDTALAEFMFSLPGHLKTSLSSTKILLRAQAATMLPTRVWHRPKRGFGVPLGHWLRFEARDIFGDVLHEARLGEFVDTSIVERLWQEHQRGQHDHQFILLRLIMLGAALRSLPH